MVPKNGFDESGGMVQPTQGASSPAVFVHENGVCESEDVGCGTRVWAFAHVLRGAVIGRDCNICDGVYIEGAVRIGDRVTVKNQVLIFDGVIIEDDVFLGPGVVFTNDLRPRAHIKRTGASLLGTTVRRGATLGAGVTVVCGTTIGPEAFVGAGAVIVNDVPAHGFMVGNPARLLGWACTCGERLPDDLACSECGRTFELDTGTPPVGLSEVKIDGVDRTKDLSG
jgi:acetyltransferase-like isoleucine patch superfamily enzyme